MIITEDYKNNIREIEKFLHTFNFPKEEEDKIRKYIANPLDVVNDDIKALFNKYDDSVVDYRIQLPTSMIRERRAAQKEIFLIMSLIVDCLSEDDQFKYSVDESGNIKPDFQLTPGTISNNYFKIKNDKRKVWRYLDSKAPNIAKKMYERWYEKKTFKWNESSGEMKEYIDLKSNTMRLGPFFDVMQRYITSLGSKSTSLRTKISKFIGKGPYIDVTGKSHSEIITLLANDIIKPTFNIIQEIISAKMLDLDKFKLFLSFNVFDWLLASTGEEWHSCIDMQSSYAYGVGLLGMCGCPDWGMLLYTDGTGKEFGGIKSYHIVTRSWVCYTNQKDFNVVNWYPKDVRNTIEFGESEDFKFNFIRGDANRRSMSDWDPIVFKNGALAWIYSDSPYFVPSKEEGKVFFRFEGSYGLPRNIKCNGKIYNDNNEYFSKVIRSITRDYTSIWDAVSHNHQINVCGPHEIKNYVCHECGNSFSDDENVVYIENEDIYVCRNCLDTNFFQCSGCDEYHRYEGDSYEVYYGSDPWSYDLICDSCLTAGLNDGDIYYDTVAERYYRGCDCVYVNESSEEEEVVSPYTLERMINNGEVFRHSDGNYYTYEENDDGNNEVPEGDA